MQTSTLTEPAPDNLSTVPTLAEGRKIAGCYVLRQDLSRAGSTPVWLASDEVLGKDVTLHFIPPAVIGDGRAMTELRQEVKKNRQLIHPNILRVYDFVEDGNCAAISMDRFEGDSVAELLQGKGRLDPGDVKPWLAQLAETLGDAHRIQLFHRDLAPSNLFLRPAGGLLVANFGLSRVMLSALERGGIVKGGDAHMAYITPQQLDGERPGVSDDVYGFGVLLYELLTGRPPFVGDDLVPKIRREVPPSMTDARASSGSEVAVPASWEKAVAACLAKTPEQRPRNLAEVVTMMGQDLGEAVAKVAPSPAPIPAAEPVGKPVEPKLDAEPAAGAESLSAAAPAVSEENVEPAIVAKAGDDLASGGVNGGSDRPVARETISESLVKKPADVSSRVERHDGPPPAPKTASRKPPVKGSLSANFPDLDRPRSKAPVVWLCLVAVIIAVFIYVKNKPDGSDANSDGSVSRIDGNNPPDENPETLPGSVAVVPPGGKEPSLPDPTPVVPNPDEPGILSLTDPTKPLISRDPGTVEVPSPSGLVPESLAGAAGVSEPKGGSVTKPGPDSRTPPDTARQPDSKSATPPDAHVAAGSLPDAPQPLPKLVLPAKATIAQLEEAKKERERAIDKARQAVAAVETVRQDSVHRLESAKTEQASLLKNLESRRKTLAPVIQRAEGLEIERRKSEEALTKAQAAADQAAKAAATAKRAYDETVAKGGEKLQAKQQAEAELRDAAAELAGRSREVEDLGQLMTKADALRQQTRLAEQQLDQDLQKISASLDQARQAEMESQRKANQEKIAGLERQVQDLQTQLGRYNAALGPLKELGEVGKEAIKKIEEKVTVANKQIGDLQAEIKRLSGSVPPNVLPKKETTNGASTQAPPPQPGPVSAFTNSLGMKFLPVGDVQFSVYLTTRKNFDAFARATGLKSEAWRNPGFKQDDDDPVVNVTWREAEAFCKWLTEKERKSGQIKPNELYRLPTDLEWSRAVALPAESGATPEERDMGVQDVYPWGQEWPPPAGAGNYAGEETQTEIPIPNYNDGYPNTSPVGKFRPNALGLYDMGGNVWQWVSDFWNAENRAKTLRGGSWYNGAIPLSLLSSCRISSSPDTLHDTYGFRIVKTPEAPKARKR